MIPQRAVESGAFNGHACTIRIADGIPRSRFRITPNGDGFRYFDAPRPCPQVNGDEAFQHFSSSPANQLHSLAARFIAENEGNICASPRQGNCAGGSRGTSTNDGNVWSTA